MAKELADLVEGRLAVGRESERRGLLLRLGAQRVLREPLEAKQLDLLGAAR